MFTRFLGIVLLVYVAAGLTGCHSPGAGTRPDSRGAGYRPPGKLSYELPGFDTLAEAKSWFKADARTEALFVFKKEQMQVLVVVSDWGNGDSWDALYFYAPDAYTQQWVPRAVWDTETRGVQVDFEVEAGRIKVRSGNGVTILCANIAALATPSSRDW